MAMKSEMSFTQFSRLDDSHPIKRILLEHIFLPDRPLLDPDERDIEHADLYGGTVGWGRKGIAWLEGSQPSMQRLWKKHVLQALRVNRYFYTEGMKILLRMLPVAFTHCAGLGSGLRFMEHVRWGAELALGSDKGCDFFSKHVSSLYVNPGGCVSIGETRAKSIVDQRREDWQKWDSQPGSSSSESFKLQEPDSPESSKTLAFTNLAHIEIRWICSRYDPIEGAQKAERAWKTCAIDDLRLILSSLEIQLLAYPRAKTLAIDFIGWDHVVQQNSPLVRPASSYIRGDLPARFLARIPEIIIRGLQGMQQDVVVELVRWALSPNGKIGTTSSHFRLIEGGKLVDVTPGKVEWRFVERQHPLLENESTALGDRGGTG